MYIESNHGPPQSIRHLTYGLNPLIGKLKEESVDYRALLMQAEIPEEALSIPDYALSPSQEINFTNRAYQKLNCPELGLIMGPNYHLSSYGMLGLAAMTSRNLIECYRVIFDNILLTWTYFKVSLYTENGHAYLQMDPVRDLGKSLRYMIERDLSAAWYIANEALDQKLPLTGVEFCHSEPQYRDVYENVFQCPIKFNAKHNRIRFDPSWLDKPLPKAEQETSRIFAAQCKEISTSLTKSYSFKEHVRYLLLNNTQGPPSLKSIAATLNTTPRTIQRKLLAENTSFQELMDDVRISISIEYLVTTQLSIEQISEHMGYSDAAAFSNAFKRWVGESPSAYRKSQS